ncbi:hypothetical protein CKO42_26925 [Lamprobacter modestohalophilus]|uniref:Uncharacterized protein n=1 Tax=Lamprobacter modestohalophilus TaxID=1064514 RepID=A0A9X0WF76_9GAMM|nr:hypothetical protein [Lamprobacter modestohalophilus]
MTINGFPVPTRHSQRREIDATAAADNADGAVWLQATRGKRARRDVARADVMHLLKEIDDLRDTEPMNPEARRPRYRNGNIERLSPLSATEETELLIVVLDREGRTGIPSETLKRSPSTSEEAFRALDRASFADDGDDQDVEWEEVFDVQAR